jgi:1,4-dihydroxy-2-naphthoyl-CoA synthase
VGDRRAREMLMLNERVPADRALEWGLVNRVVPSVRKDGEFVRGATQEQIELALAARDGYSISLELLDAAVAELVRKLLEQFPECTRYTKQQVNFWKDLAWHQTIGHGRDWLALHYASHEPWEGMRAFVEKRPARYMALRESAANGESSEFVWGAYEQECAHCGATGLPTRFAFCGACGATLNGATHPADLAPAGAREEESQ